MYKGNEVSSIEDVPEGAIGFIYLMINVSNGKKYIGKKLLYSERRKALTKKEIGELTSKRLKKWKMVKKESDWLTYNSSSEDIKNDMKAGHLFTKVIIEFTFSKIQTTYLEVKLQFVNKVLESDDWYNNNINSSWFRGNIGINNGTEQ